MKITKIEITEYQDHMLDGVDHGNISPDSVCDQWCDHLKGWLEGVYTEADVTVDWLTGNQPTEVALDVADGDPISHQRGDYRDEIHYASESAWVSFAPINLEADYA